MRLYKAKIIKSLHCDNFSEILSDSRDEIFNFVKLLLYEICALIIYGII